MARYQAEAAPLGKEAIAAALDAAGVDAADIGLLVVCSCTGYAAPGLDVSLAADLGMGAGTLRMVIGHMGCYAALPGLAAAADHVAVSGRPALLLCVELTSLHVQPVDQDPQQIVVHSLFSDAAAAVVLLPGASGYALRDVVSLTDSRFADHMTWDVTGTGFRMGLSPRVPDVLAMHVRDLVADLLARHGLTIADVDGWAVHPGGPRILDVVTERLALPASAVAASRRVLAEHGNCSSPTVLMIVDELLRRPGGAPRTVVMLAFGPGLTLYGALLSWGGGRPAA
jgi:predicted naringenin-chalcone synthase